MGRSDKSEQDRREEERLRVKAAKISEFYRLLYGMRNTGETKSVEDMETGEDWIEPVLVPYRIYFFALLSPATKERHALLSRDEFAALPLAIGNTDIRKPVSKGWGFKDAFFHAIASATIGSKDFWRVVAKLEQWNGIGYDIFSTANPLTYKRRMQLTVSEIRHLTIESDFLTMTEQTAFLEMLKPSLKAAVHTGNKSVHFYIPLEPAIRNPHCLYGNRYRDIDAKDPKAEPEIIIPECEAVKAYWQRQLEAWSFPPDRTVLSDFAKLLRVPYFTHGKSGKEATVLFMDSEQKNVFRPSLTFLSDSIDLNAEGKKQWDQIRQATLTGKDSILLSDREDQADRDSHNPGNARVSISGKQASAAVPGKKGTSARGQKGKAKNIGVCIQDMTMLYTQASPKPSDRRFLDDLEDYFDLMRNGLPAKGTRFSFHPVMFTARRAFRMNDEEMLARWKAIIGKAPDSTAMTAHEAAADLLSEWQRVQKREGSWKGADQEGRLWLPNTSQLPDLDSVRMDHLKRNLKAWGCQNVTGTANLISRVLYPLVKDRPNLCLAGTVSIPSRSMRAVSVRYKAVLAWLASVRVMEIRDSSYTPGHRSMLYYVSVPLVLYLLGFKTADLDWGTAKAA